MTIRTLFGGAVPASGISDEPGAQYTLGLRFRCLVDGHVVGLSLYKTQGNLDTSRDFGLWSVIVGTGSSATLLGSATSSGEPVDGSVAPGWINLEFAAPLAVTTGIDYVIGVRDGGIGVSGNQASYAFESHKFGAADLTNDSSTLVAPKNAGTSVYAGNGLFDTGSGDVLIAPHDSFNETWYGVDVLFDDGTSAPAQVVNPLSGRGGAAAQPLVN